MSMYSEEKAKETTLRAFPSGVSRLVSASFDDLDNALDATRKLETKDFSRDRISVLMSTDRREHYIATHSRFGELEENAVVVDEVALEKRRRTAEGAGAGGAIGGAVGAVGAAVAAVGTTLVFPPLGIAIAGPVAAMLAGLGAGAATGGVVGALVGAGMTEYRAKRFHDHIQEGRIVVSVLSQTEPESRQVEDILEDAGGHVIAEESEV